LEECEGGRAVDRPLEIQEAVTDQVGVAAEDDELSKLNSPLKALKYLETGLVEHVHFFLDMRLGKD